MTEQNARRLSQPRTGADGKPIRTDPRAKPGATAAAGDSAAETQPDTDTGNRTVRPVGPTFLPAR